MSQSGEDVKSIEGVFEQLARATQSGEDPLFTDVEPLGSLDERWEAFEHAVWGPPPGPRGRHAAPSRRRTPPRVALLAAVASVVVIATVAIARGLSSPARPLHVQTQDVVDRSPVVSKVLFCDAATGFFKHQDLGASGAGQDLGELSEMERWAPASLRTLMDRVGGGVAPLLVVQALPGFSATVDNAIVARGLREDASTDMSVLKSWVGAGCKPAVQAKMSGTVPPETAASTTTSTTVVASSATTLQPPLPLIPTGCVTWMPNLIGLTYAQAGIEIDVVLVGRAVVGNDDVSPGNLVVSSYPSRGTCIDALMDADGTFPVTLDY